MKNLPQLRARLLVFGGLLGMSTYQIMLHVRHPALIDNALVHGLWLGACFGLELLGLYLLAKQSRVPVARKPDRS